MSAWIFMLVCAFMIFSQAQLIAVVISLINSSVIGALDPVIILIGFLGDIPYISWNGEKPVVGLTESLIVNSAIGRNLSQSSCIPLT